MGRHRSFSFKSTRFLVIFFTISSFIFLVSFSAWFVKSNLSIHHETHFQFNKSFLNLGSHHKPITVETLSSFSSNDSARSVKHGIVKATPSVKPGNASGSEKFSVSKEIQRLKEGDSETEDPETKQEDERGPSIEEIEVESNELTEEYEVRANSVGKLELPNIKEDNGEKNTRETSADKNEVPSNGKIEENNINTCDVTRGKWVYNEQYPLYTNGSCPFVDEGFNCDNNGRRDRNYMKWKWQPDDCDFPTFNATKMLDLIRGKRLVFVGDSINRNQWESMLCMLMTAISDPKKVYETHGRRITKKKGNYSFKFVDYKCTVEYYVSHFLVQESKARIGPKPKPTLRIDAIDHGSSKWRGADILVFNTAHWCLITKQKLGSTIIGKGTKYIHDLMSP